MSTSPRKTVRVSAACDFCRKRKLGCDNSKPKCESCRLRDVECTYARRAQRIRPSNARIHGLEAEVARLRDLLRTQNPELDGDEDPPQGSQHHPDGHDRSVTPDTVGDFPDENRDKGPEPSLAVAAPTETGEGAPFHGPTSIMFQPRPFKETNPTPTDLSTASLKNHLLSAAAKQRQLDALNLAAGKLNFEGLDPKLGIEILSCFWNRGEYSGSMVYKPVFMRDMASNGPYFSKLLLNAMLFAGSKHSDHLATQDESFETYATGQHFRREFEKIINDTGLQVLFKSEVTTIQALLIFADCLFSWCGEPSLSWHYIGIAISMIVDLGIHADGITRLPPGKRSPEDIEVHRRVFWAAFSMDKVQSIYQGRPARLREADCRVPVQFLDDFEELEQFSTHTFSEIPKLLPYPAYAVSALEQFCKLSITMDRILSGLYTEHCKDRAVGQDQGALQTLQTLRSDLKRWKDEMPAHLWVRLEAPATSTILPHTLNLLAMYNSLIILLHRPFVSDGHLQTVSIPTSRNAFSACAAAALEIHRSLELYRQHFCLKAVPYFISYATYVSATIHVRMAAQKGPDSMAHTCFLNCLGILADQQLKCDAPRLALKILLELARRLHVPTPEMTTAGPLHCGINQIRGRARSNGEPGGLISQAHTRGIPDQAGRQTAFDASNALLDAPQTGDFTPLSSDFDIDEVMRSFDLAPQKEAAPQVESLPTSGFQGLAGDGGGLLWDWDNNLFPDVLYGLDFGLR